MCDLFIYKVQYLLFQIGSIEKNIFRRSVRRRGECIKIEVESRRQTTVLGNGLGDLIQSAQAGSSLGQGCPTKDQSAQLDGHATEKGMKRFSEFGSRRQRD